jgi:hypothetical protein
VFVQNLSPTCCKRSIMCGSNLTLQKFMLVKSLVEDEVFNFVVYTCFVVICRLRMSMAHKEEHLVLLVTHIQIGLQKWLLD